MPIQPSPPYYPAALTYPRQIVRWDDVNSQNGKLERAKLYLPFPSFTATPNWIGVSDIVAAFNFECNNNFTIPVDAINQPVVPNYLVTVQVGQAVQDNRIGIGAEGNNNTLIS